jgi:hypothetical protein
VRGETGNGAKFWPNGSANKACVAGVRLGKIFHFRRPFLWFISFGRTKEPSRIKALIIGQIIFCEFAEGK